MKLLETTDNITQKQYLRAYYPMGRLGLEKHTAFNSAHLEVRQDDGEQVAGLISALLDKMGKDYKLSVIKGGRSAAINREQLANKVENDFRNMSSDWYADEFNLLIKQSDTKIGVMSEVDGEEVAFVFIGWSAVESRALLDTELSKSD